MRVFWGFYTELYGGEGYEGKKDIGEIFIVLVQAPYDEAIHVVASLDDVDAQAGIHRQPDAVKHQARSKPLCHIINGNCQGHQQPCLAAVREPRGPYS